MKFPFVSIIVPVYNPGIYFKDCLLSLMRQSYKNLDIILVDDGSSDGSSEICDAFAQKDDRIKVFHKPNGGVSSARNEGIKNASGEWISFVDADDTLPSNAIELLYNHCDEDTDVVIGDFNSLLNGIKTQYSHPVFTQRDEFVHNYIASDWVVCYGNLISASLIKGNNLLFPENLRYSEDFYFMTGLLLKAKGIKQCLHSVYTYNRDNENQATRKNLELIYSYQRESFHKCINDFSSSKYFPLIKKGLYWKLLLSEQIIFKTDLEKIDSFCELREKRKYIFSCPHMSRKMKLIMYLSIIGFGGFIKFTLSKLNRIKWR